MVAREPRNTRETGSRLLDPTPSTSPSLKAMSSTAPPQVLLCRSARTAARKPWPASAPVSAAISRSATPRRLTQPAGLRRNSWLRSELTIPPNPGRSARPHAIPARRPAGHESAVRTAFFAPRSAPTLPAMDDGPSVEHRPFSFSTRHDSTAYVFASRQKSPTNNLLGQRISHTVLSEFPDASLPTYPRLASREQGQSRPGKGTCAVEHKALGQLMASRIRRSARSPRLPICLQLVTRLSQSLGLLSRMDLDRQPSWGEPDRRPRLPARTRGRDDENLGSPGVGMHC